jgi:hypothetical protein
MSPKFKNPRARFNFQGRTCSITGVGSYVPSKILTNAELEKMVDTSDEWITTRTGIKERRVAAKNEFTSDMAVKAAQRAMKMAGVIAEQIDLIIRGDHHPGHAVSLHRLPGAAKTWRPPRRRLRSGGGLLGLHLWPGNRTAIHHVAHL